MFTLALLLDTETVCDAGTVLLGAKLKLKELGFAESGLVPPPELTLSCTGMDRNPADELTLMNPTSVPEVGAPAPTDTVRERGVVPLAGVTTSQLLLEKAATVTLTGPLDEDTSTVCEGVGIPACVLNVNCVGLAESVELCPLAASIEHSSARIKVPNVSEVFVRFTRRSNKKLDVVVGKRGRGYP